MIRLLDMQNSGYDLISLPEILPDAHGGHSCPKCGSQRCNHCGQADAFHNAADELTLLTPPTGALATCLYNVADELTLLTPPTGQPTTSLWDGNGNLLSENAGGQLTSYSWDGENRLAGVAYPTGAPDTFSYSNDGLRQRKVTASGTVQFVWDEQNVLLEADQTGATQAHYTDFPGMWGGLASQRRSGASNFYGFDQQASARVLVTAGAISDSYLYKAFGEELLITGSTANQLRFGGMVGYYRDTSTRLYFGSQYLRTDLGMWISKTHPGALLPPGLRFGPAGRTLAGSLFPIARKSNVRPWCDQHGGGCFWCYYNHLACGEYHGNHAEACTIAKDICHAQVNCDHPICPNCGTPRPAPPPPRPPDFCQIFQARNWDYCIYVCKELQGGHSVLLNDLINCCDQIMNAGNPDNLPLPGLPGPFEFPSVNYNSYICGELWCKSLNQAGKKTGRNWCLSEGTLLR